MVRQYSQKFEFEHLVGEVLGDDLVLQLLFRGEEQVHDLHAGFVGQVELVVSMGVLAAVLTVARHSE